MLKCPADRYCSGGDFRPGLPGSIAVACPSGAGTVGALGSTELGACAAPPGSYFDEATGTVKKCPKGAYCAGGSVTKSGKVKNPCITGTSTAAPGASQYDQCTVPPGSFLDPSGKVVPCSKGSFCPGGSVSSSSLQVKCPELTDTPSTGFSKLSDCLVPPGYFYEPDEGLVKPCPLNKVCSGGPVSGEVKGVEVCPDGTQTLTEGNSQASACIVPKGSYNDNGIVRKCPTSAYCLGGPFAGLNSPAVTSCPTGTSVAAEGRSSLSDCLVPRGKFNDNGTIRVCDVGFWCSGGGYDSAGRIATACPTGQTTVTSGSGSASDCTAIVVPAGSYWDTTTSSIVTCPGEFLKEQKIGG